MNSVQTCCDRVFLYFLLLKTKHGKDLDCLWDTLLLPLPLYRGYHHIVNSSTDRLMDRDVDRLITSSRLPGKKQPGRKHFSADTPGKVRKAGRILWLQHHLDVTKNALCHFLLGTSDFAAAVFPKLNLVILDKTLRCRKYVCEKKQIKKVIKLQLFFLGRNILIIPCFHLTDIGSYVPNLLLDLYSKIESQNMFYLFLLGACEKYIQCTLTSSAWSQDCKIFRLRYIYWFCLYIYIYIVSALSKWVSGRQRRGMKGGKGKSSFDCGKHRVESQPHIFRAVRNTDNQHLNSFENPFQHISGLGNGQRS